MSVTSEFEGADFFADEWLYDDPYPYFAFLREEKGRVWIDERYNTAFVTGHDEEVEVLRNYDTFSSCNAPAGPFAPLPVAVEGDDASALIDQYRDQMPMHEFMVTMDRPQHDEYRGLLKRFFTPKRLKENEDYMWRLADEQMDTFIDAGTVEFSSQYSSPFAGLVIADLLGVPSEDMPRFREWFEENLKHAADDAEMAEDPLAFFHDSFVRYITERREQPLDDVLTHLAQATFSDGSVPDMSILAREASFAFAAGQETTVRLITFSLRYLAENPDVQDRLRRERDLIPSFLEEMLRLEAPIRVHFRMARRTSVLGGVTVPAGTHIALMNGAANRDPRRFEDPDRAIIDRPNVREQLAFSRGIHSCIGQSLARAESRVTIERVFDRMSDIKVSEAHHGPAGDRTWEYLPTWLFRGLTELHLEYTATGD